MLVLSRQRDETIMIGDDVQITVVDVRGDKVRLGITAPRHIQVHRKEVYDAIKRENQQAAKLRPRDVTDVIDHDAEKNRSETVSRDVVKNKSGTQSRDAKDEKPRKESDEGQEPDEPRPSNHAGRSR